jgi:hypothetical protein
MAEAALLRSAASSRRRFPLPEIATQVRILPRRLLQPARYLFSRWPRKVAFSARLRMQIVASRLRAGDRLMATDQERQTDATRYAVYTVAAMTAALVLVFLYLFNYTSFFKLAVPL